MIRPRAHKYTTISPYFTGVHNKIKDQQCHLCDLAFSELGKLNRHIKTVHEKIKNHICSICGKGFFRLYDLKRHLKTNMHYGPKEEPTEDILTENQEILDNNNKCDLCGKVYGKRASLKSHIKFVHENVRNHECPQCGKKFGTEWNLKKHVKTGNFISTY